jgi:hypothetical protein
LTPYPISLLRHELSHTRVKSPVRSIRIMR